MRHSQKITQCFNAGAKTYDEAAVVQLKTANILCTRLPPKVDHILEIGSGTGLLSKLIIQKYPKATIELTDIAKNMVAICQNRYASPQITVNCLDGENISALAPNYDLIVSSMAMHWFQQPSESIKNLTSKLLPQGKLFFAMLGAGSFSTWQAFCQAQQVSVPTPIFPSAKELAIKLPQFIIDTEVIQQSYANTFHFLSSLKLIGAHAARATHHSFSAGTLRHLMRTFDAINPQGLSMRYEIIYGYYQQC